MINLSIGEAMLVLRRRKGWTQAQLAEKVDSCINTILEIERDAANPKLSTLSDIFDALDYDIAFSLTEAEPDDDTDGD